MNTCCLAQHRTCGLPLKPTLRSTAKTKPFVHFAGEVRLLQLMAMLGPVWGDLRPPTARAMLQQLTQMLQVRLGAWGVLLCRNRAALLCQQITVTSGRPPRQLLQQLTQMLQVSTQSA